MNLERELNRAPELPFVPMLPLRNSVLQTVLTTVRLDIPESLLAWGIPLLIDAGPDETGQDDGGVRLVAYFTPRRSGTSGKGVVILLHGWEGCSHSNYNLVTARELVDAGYDVFRLNLRDHGPGLHVHPQSLNPGVFLGTLLAETVRATARCAEMLEPQPVYVVGFSMGGNFALRAAIRYGDTAIPNLSKVIAVNPAINPLWSTVRIDRSPAMRRHFRKPWMEQLRQKQRFYPDLYNFEPVEAIGSLIDMTTWLVRNMGLYADAETYFTDYAVLGDATRDLRIPTHILTTMDDMVVPVADFYGLAPNPNLTIDIHAHGGHVGYLEGCPPQHRVGALVRRAIECGPC